MRVIHNKHGMDKVLHTGNSNTIRREIKMQMFVLLDLLSHLLWERHTERI